MSTAPVLVRDVPEVAERPDTHVQVETPPKWISVLWAGAIICLGIVACFLLMNSMCCSG